jgi:hypothetical protein
VGVELAKFPVGSSVISMALRLMDWKRISKRWTKIFKVLVFYIIGVVFYHYNMGWSIVDCIYFITVTITSVGSGQSHFSLLSSHEISFLIDMATTHQITEVWNSFNLPYDVLLVAGRLFTVFYSSFGLAFIFATMNSFATSIIKAAEESALERINTNPEQNRVRSTLVLSLLISPSGSIHCKVSSLHCLDCHLHPHWDHFCDFQRESEFFSGPILERYDHIGISPPSCPAPPSQRYRQLAMEILCSSTNLLGSASSPSPPPHLPQDLCRLLHRYLSDCCCRCTRKYRNHPPRSCSRSSQARSPS